jgi:hypothetical protein
MKTAAILNDASARISALQAPASDAVLFRRFVSVLQRRAAIANAIYANARAHRTKQAQALLKEGAADQTQMAGLARQLGFTDCLPGG